MNYAEDRLDRRARYSKEKNHDKTGISPLEADLKQAYNLLRTKNHSNVQELASASTTSTGNQNLFHQGAGYDREEFISKIRGHELCGRTLRDCGRNREALFHYGQAWIYAHLVENGNMNEVIRLSQCEEHQQDNKCQNNQFDLNEEEKAVGDYAQMAEFNGVPEIGIIALLFYYNGGSLSLDDLCTFNVAEDSDGVQSDLYNDFKDSIDCDQKWYVPASLLSSAITNCIISSFDALLQNMKRKQTEKNNFDNSDESNNNEIYTTDLSAGTILDMISKQSTMLKKHKKKFGSIKGMETSFASKEVKATIQIKENLRFWNPLSSSHIILCPLLQILLLKLLYVNPLGGPFLYLATEALYHLSMTTMPLDSSSSDLSRYMAKNYKSHWAYYVLIYKVLFGERMKKHRIQRGDVPYHVPVWDIIHGLNERKCVIASKRHSVRENKDSTSDGPQIKAYLKYVCENLFVSTSKSLLPRSWKKIMTIPYILGGQKCNPIYALGDSHVLSIGWQTIVFCNRNQIDHIEETKYRTIIPYPVTGLKAWHTRSDTKFFTYSNLRSNIQRLPSHCRTIILSTGEIDCREGIGGTLLQGFYQNCDDAVANTVREYIKAIHIIAEEFDLQILILPVAPHAKRSEKNGKSKGRAMRRERMVIWNDLLRSIIEERQSFVDSMKRLCLLDYEESLRFQDETSPVGFVLNPSYNADYTHMNSAFLPHLEASIQRSGYDFALI